MMGMTYLCSLSSQSVNVSEKHDINFPVVIFNIWGRARRGAAAFGGSSRHERSRSVGIEYCGTCTFLSPVLPPVVFNRPPYPENRQVFDVESHHAFHLPLAISPRNRLPLFSFEKYFVVPPSLCVYLYIFHTTQVFLKLLNRGT